MPPPPVEPHAETETVPKSRRTDSADTESPRKTRLAGRVRRLLIRLGAVVFVVVLIPVALVPAYRYVDPPLTSVMVIRWLGGAAIDRQWRDLDAISPHLARSVLVAEDARFCAHRGVDLAEMRKAIDDAADGGRLRGASTITMQTVKNLFLWPQRSWLRKAVELPLALYADFIWPKRRTMEIYLNIVEWDAGIYGAEAAARHHFNVPAAQLTAAQAARLAAVLPDPRGRDPTASTGQVSRLAGVYAARAARSGAYIDCLEG